MQIYNDEGYLKWSASQNRQVKSICAWAWVLQRIYDVEIESTMGRAVGSTVHKINELSLNIRHQIGELPDHETVDKWAETWFYYYIEKDGKRMLSHEKEYYKSDIECIADYLEVTQMLSRKCIDECTPNIKPMVIDGKLAIEMGWSFIIEEFKIKLRGFFDVIEEGGICSDLKIKAARPLIKEKDSGANKVSSIEKDEQFIIYSAARLAEIGEYPTVKAHFILNRNNKKLGPHNIYNPVETKHNDNYMAVLSNNLRGIPQLIEEVAKNGKHDLMLPASEYSYFCSNDVCDYWYVCDKHY